MCRLTTLAAPLLLILFLSATPSPALAGGGPENVLLVVNQNSQASLTVANYYIRLRDIPPQNVVYIDWDGPLAQVGFLGFKNKLLKPILGAIKQRGLSEQIDYIVYSADFPWSVNVWKLLGGKKAPIQMRPIASLNGATYLWQPIMDQDISVMGSNVNWYVPEDTNRNLRDCTSLGQVASQGFRASYNWGRGGRQIEDASQGKRYYLSCMLGVTQGRGNTVAEIAKYLVASAGADATHPEGTFYFAQNSNVRSKARHRCYRSAVQLLTAEGAKAKVVQGVVPNGAKDVMGLMMGVAKFNLPKARLRIQPGAICEHLTSVGGNLNADSYQTPLSVFLRAGAAGASGTVTEPTALQAKFPLPSVHVHYRRGCSLAEAFYQSIASPYQLLIVGDPLTQPWANRPKFNVQAPNTKSVSGTIELSPSTNSAVADFECFLDGKLQTKLKVGQAWKLDTTQLSEGHHEARVVAVSSDPIQTRGRWATNFFVENQKAPPLRLLIEPAGDIPQTGAVRLTARGGTGGDVTFFQNSRKLGSAGVGKPLELPAQDLGRGPSRLRAVEASAGAWSKAAWVWVE